MLLQALHVEIEMKNLNQSRRHGGDLVASAPPNKAPSSLKLKYETL